MVKLRTKNAGKVGAAIRGRRHGYEFVDVPQSGMVVARTLFDDTSPAAVAGAYVKVSPTLRASERATFDSKAVRERLLAAGAIAVVVVPVVVPDSTGDLKRADRAVAAAMKPEQHLREWFDGVKGASVELVDEAMAEALASVGEVGL